MSLTVKAKKIKYLLEYYDISPSSFADKINIQRSSMSHILSGRNKPSLDVIEKTLDIYPDINSNWLIRDNETQMLVSKPDFTPNLEQKEEEIAENAPSPTSQNEKNSEKNEDQNNPLIGYTEINEESTIPMSALSSKKDKKIAKIVIFYTDKTMESYEPN